MESYPAAPRPSTAKTTGKVGKTPTTGAGPRPTTTYADGWLDRIPSELKADPQWVVWRHWVRGGKWTKVLFQPSDPTEEAKVNTPSTWSTFEAAVAAYEARTGRGGGRNHTDRKSRLDGIGRVFSADDPYCGVDLDACIGPDGIIIPAARPYVESLETYGEISPSGRGIKFIGLAKLPGNGHNKRGVWPDKTGAVELYDRGRFFTFTGNQLDGHPELVFDIQAAVSEILAEFWPAEHKPARPKVTPPPLSVSDQDLLAIARKAKNGQKFAALFDFGDVNGGKTHSEADLALCNLLAFYWHDEAAIDRMFRQSQLYRDKWERADYRGWTIAKALDGKTEFYSPRPKPAPFSSGPNGDVRTVPSTNGDGKSPIDPSVNGHVEQPREPSLNERLAKRPRTDLGNAERLVARHGSDLRFCHPWKKWLVWDGKRWKLDDTGGIRRRARQTVRSIFREAATIADDETRKAHGLWQLSSETRDKLGALVSLAEAEEGIPVLPADLDLNPWLLNCPNGTLDLRTGRLREHRREDRITRLCPVPYVHDAECPLWTATLRKVLAENQAVISFVRRLCGCILTGTVTEQILPILHGSGANGKSTLLNTLLELLGTDYAMKAPPELLMVKRTESHPTERASLFGKRLVVAIETGEGARINETLIKELTGSDVISARRMREDFWEFKPTHKILLSTNHKPAVRGTDYAIWRRLKLIPFNVKITDAEADKDMPEKLLGELPGILAWCVRGCLDWQEGGLNPPKEVTDATEEYRKDEDVLGAFLEENCTVLDGLRAKSSDLYTRYHTWAERSGESPVNQSRFGKAMTERGFDRVKDSSIYYTGIGLRSVD